MESTLVHYFHTCGVYQGIRSNNPPEPWDAPEWSSAVIDVERDHPFYVVEQVLRASLSGKLGDLMQCLSDECNDHIAEVKGCLGSITQIGKYLCIPFGEDHYAVDLWDNTGIPKHERKIRLFLVWSEGEQWQIERVLRLMPYDAYLDSSGIVRECDEYLFEEAATDDRVDQYSTEVVAGSGTDVLIKIIGLCRSGNVTEFAKFLSPHDRNNAWFVRTLICSIRRIISVQEIRSCCTGVNEDGGLSFQFAELDITATNWMNEILDWQIEMEWSSERKGWRLKKMFN